MKKQRVTLIEWCACDSPSHPHPHLPDIHAHTHNHLYASVTMLQASLYASIITAQCSSSTGMIGFLGNAISQSWLIPSNSYTLEWIKEVDLWMGRKTRRKYHHLIVFILWQPVLGTEVAEKTNPIWNQVFNNIEQTNKHTIPKDRFITGDLNFESFLPLLSFH